MTYYPEQGDPDTGKMVPATCPWCGSRSPDERRGHRVSADDGLGGLHFCTHPWHDAPAPADPGEQERPPKIVCPEHGRWVYLRNTPQGEQYRPCPECGYDVMPAPDPPQQAGERKPPANCTCHWKNDGTRYADPNCPADHSHQAGEQVERRYVVRRDPDPEPADDPDDTGQAWIVWDTQTDTAESDWFTEADARAAATELDLRAALDQATQQLREAEGELERLREEGSPGVLHKVDQAFYDLTVKQRDSAWREAQAAEARAERLSADLKEANRRDKHGQRKRAEAAEANAASLRTALEETIGFLEIAATGFDSGGYSGPAKLLREQAEKLRAALNPKGSDGPDA